MLSDLVTDINKTVLVLINLSVISWFRSRNWRWIWSLWSSRPTISDVQEPKFCLVATRVTQDVRPDDPPWTKALDDWIFQHNSIQFLYVAPNHSRSRLRTQNNTEEFWEQTDVVIRRVDLYVRHVPRCCFCVISKHPWLRLQTWSLKKSHNPLLFNRTCSWVLKQRWWGRGHRSLTTHWAHKSNWWRAPGASSAQTSPEPHQQHLSWFWAQHQHKD